ncbi:sodium:proton antiporter [Leptospira mtsangambouensis]|uniref:sodium:proton antiporter n=1 Tax=Leptospira mtsangambouensis TaxID=2484912 RepID=UPI001EEC8C8A|nr:sodium:proton antiporter [Leptospira mtsangambouensis]MCG6139453.1 sodium:proton antiporter [Leptospira mtsangambouensis]
MLKKLLTTIVFLVCLSVTSAGLFAEDPTPVQAQTTTQEETGHSSHGESVHQELPYWSVLPFVAILLSIAILPVASHKTSHWWEDNNNKLILAVGLGAISFVVLLIYGYSHNIVHTVFFDYIPFIILLGSLFYISGGIVIKGDIHATPLNNTLYLLIGAGLASFIGTTGASMLLIRPLLKTNSERKHVVHTVVFFIFLVSNIGGSLTPLGDPPLFLGYLKGVPFTWTFKLLPEMLFATVILLAVYFVWDTLAYKKETKKDLKKDDKLATPFSIGGQVNFIWLLGVILAVAFLNSNYIPEINNTPSLGFIREAVLIVLIGLSKFTSKEADRKFNNFTLHPIQEVAYLFIGIFITMIPALVLLEAHGKELGITQNWQFFWATGAFSSVLDNAPTYLTFGSLASGLLTPAGAANPLTLGQFIGNVQAEEILKAISVGAVFMGANTYIGNAPNFMVKSVAEENKVKMPSFGGYLAYSMGILIPVFILITFVFFV